MAGGCVHGIQFSLVFREFLAHLVPYLGLVLPVETDPTGLVLHGKGLQHGRHGIRHSGKHPLVAALLLGLHHFPVLGNGLGIRGLHVGEYMGVAENQLVANLVQHVPYVIPALFLGNPGVENYVQQHISELLLEFLRGLVTLAEDDSGLDQLSPDGVRDTCDSTLQHCGVCDEDRFDLERTDFVS